MKKQLLYAFVVLGIVSSSYAMNSQGNETNQDNETNRAVSVSSNDGVSYVVRSPVYLGPALHGGDSPVDFGNNRDLSPAISVINAFIESSIDELDRMAARIGNTVPAPLPQKKQDGG